MSNSDNKIKLKRVIILIFILLMVGCGKEEVKITTTEKKRELIGKVLQDDMKARKEYEEIITKLQKQEEKGIKEAKVEREKWSEIEREFFKKQVEENEKNINVNVDNREYGY